MSGSDVGERPSADQPARGHWRYRIKVHPAADLFPMSSDIELKELGEDIDKNGLHHPLVFWTPLDLAKLGARPETRARRLSGNLLLLDGRNRLEAMQRHLRTDDERLEAALDEYTLLSGSYGLNNPYAYVISANLRRRHLTPAQRRELIGKLLKATPEKSDRAIAKEVGVDHKTVATVRYDKEATGEVPQLATTRGADGRTRRRHQAAQRKSGTPSPTVPAAQVRDKAIMDFSAVLHRRLADTLDDLTRLLRDAQITEKLPREKRVVLAREYLAALGVSPADLQAAGEAA